MIFDAESLEALPDERRKFYLRLMIAQEVFVKIIDSKGNKTDKAFAAVGYADTLLERLETTVNTSETNGTKRQ